jgi:hypothetical protein
MRPASQLSTRTVLIHVAFGLLTLFALFATVHNRDTESEAFEDVARAGGFDDRWNDLSDHWTADGWFANGGMYYLNQCDWFTRGKDAGSLQVWLGDNSSDTDPHYFYRSNSMLWLAPLHIAQRAQSTLAGGSSSRRVTVWYAQIIVMFTAIAIGLAGTLLGRHSGLRFGHAITLGLATQVVLQTSPINLDAWWGFYMQHAFALPVAMLALSFALPARRGRLWVRILAVSGLFIADLPQAVVMLAGWAALNAILSPRLFRCQRWGYSVLLPAAVTLAVIGIQYLVVAIGTPNSTFAGSGLFFRTGLDGNTRYFQSLWDGSFGFIWKSNIQNGSDGGVASPVFWIAGGLACLAVFAICTWRRGLDRQCYVLAVLAVSFLPFFLLFPNAISIHPYAYPAIAVPCLTFGLFSALPQALVNRSRNAWPVILIAATAAIVLAAVHIRAYSTARPLDMTNLNWKLPGLTHDQTRL